MSSVSVIFLISCVLAMNLQTVKSKRMSFEQIKAALQPVKKICIERVGIDPKMIDDANNGKFVPDRKLQCYFKCMLVMTKAMKDDKIREEVFANNAKLMLLEELVAPAMKAMQHCQSIVSKPLEGCELAYEMAKCYYEYDPTLVFYP